MSQQTSYSNQGAALAGLVAGDPPGQKSWINSVGVAKEVIDVAIDTVTSSATYAFTINGISVSYTADASATALEIRAGLIANARANPLFEQLASFNISPTGGATAPVRVTAKSPDVDLSYADSDAKLSASAITAFVAAVVIPFGRAVVKDDASGANERSARLPTTPTAQVSTITPTPANTEPYSFSIRMQDTGEIFKFDFTSDGSGTAAEFVTALTAQVNESGVPVTASGSATLILTSDNPGRKFDVVSDDTNLATVATTASAYGEFVGVCRRMLSEVSSTLASGTSATGGTGEGVAPGKTFNVVDRGLIWVETEVTVSVGDQLFFRHTASGANTALGRFRITSDTNTCLPIPRDRARVIKGCTGAGLALIEVLY